VLAFLPLVEDRETPSAEDSRLSSERKKELRRQRQRRAKRRKLRTKIARYESGKVRSAASTKA